MDKWEGDAIRPLRAQPLPGSFGAVEILVSLLLTWFVFWQVRATCMHALWLSAAQVVRLLSQSTRIDCVPQPVLPAHLTMYRSPPTTHHPPRTTHHAPLTLPQSTRINNLSRRITHHDTTAANYTVMISRMPTERRPVAEVAEYFAGWGEVVHVGIAYNHRDLILAARERAKARAALHSAQVAWFLAKVGSRRLDTEH